MLDTIGDPQSCCGGSGMYVQGGYANAQQLGMGLGFLNNFPPDTSKSYLSSPILQSQKRQVFLNSIAPSRRWPTNPSCSSGTSHCTMPLSTYAPPVWQEQYNSYNPMYDWEENTYHALPVPRPMEEQKYTPGQEFLEFDHQPLTAIGKSSDLFKDLYTKTEIPRPMKQWSPQEVMEWLCKEANKYNYEYEGIHLENFHEVDGCTLLKMTVDDFIEKENRFGKFLFEAVDRRRRSEEAYQDDNLPPFKNIRHQEDLTYTDLDREPMAPCRPVLSDNDSYISDSSSQETIDSKPANIIVKAPPPPGRRPVGRPPKPTRPKRGNKEKKCGRLWEFIRDLLLKPEYCPSLICWENHDEGIFRFVRSDKVAELWGTIKDNPKMTYEKLSRAMRYYYKSKVLQPVLGRRLVYKFGPTARGWRTNNPNFRDSPK